MNSDYILLKEDPNVDYEPTMEEIIEEAKFLGIGPGEEDFYWIAKEALRVRYCKDVTPLGSSPSSLGTLSESQNRLHRVLQQSNGRSQREPPDRRVLQVALSEAAR